jgi:hypothetical protein
MVIFTPAFHSAIVQIISELPWIARSSAIFGQPAEESLVNPSRLRWTPLVAVKAEPGESTWALVITEQSDFVLGAWAYIWDGSNSSTIGILPAELSEGSLMFLE